MENKKLYRSKNNRMLAGVCGGIAEYLEWDATLVRILFFLSGIGLLSYFILVLIIPTAPYSSSWQNDRW